MLLLSVKNFYIIMADEHNYFVAHYSEICIELGTKFLNKTLLHNGPFSIRVKLELVILVIHEVICPTIMCMSVNTLIM